MQKLEVALFIFHRDLRVADNHGLMAAVKCGLPVLPCFIFDPAQLEAHPYRSTPALTFLLRSLEELDTELRRAGGRLYVFHGEPRAVLSEVQSSLTLRACYTNRDYTPFARNRERAIQVWAAAQGVACHLHTDLLLTEPEQVLKDDGSPYVVYTPFAKRASAVAVAKPQTLSAPYFYTETLPIEYSSREVLDPILAPLDKPFRRGGRTEALAILDRVAEFSAYHERRDMPADESGTSGLSPHLKFGTISPREVYWRIEQHLGSKHLLVRELLWRDFFHHIAWHFPHVFKGAFHPHFDRIEWENSEAKFSRWCEGSTGFPIVDAGMHQLRQTGFMHNRVRMIVASFLTKDLHIDWRWGERYFATQLLDYDPSVNNGNWQWAASTGCDAQPYFRIFNPWLQQAKFDPQAEYIKRWVPELAGVPARQLHTLHDDGATVGAYPQPMVDHSEERSAAEEAYSRVAKRSKGD